MNFSIITVSDRCHAGTAEDVSGPELRKVILKLIPNSKICSYFIVPDDVPQIVKKLLELTEKKDVNVILTTGGTGFAARDVSPEALLSVIEKRAHGLEIAMLTESLKITPFAMLSRAVCGIRNNTLLINLPGSPKGAIQCFEVIAPCLPHAIDLLNNDLPKVKSLHVESNKGEKNLFTEEVVSKIKYKIIERYRESPWRMLEVDEAQNILKSISPKIKDKEIVPLTDAHGRVLAQNFLSPIDIPSVDVSKKDGYAVKSEDGNHPRTVVNKSEPSLDVSELSPLSQYECVRVTTGAPIPFGANAIVQVEDTEILRTNTAKTEEIEISIKVVPHLAQDIRKRGSDLKVGDFVVSSGKCLQSTDLGRLASVGAKKVNVLRKPRVAVLSTGNELVDPFQSSNVKPGAVYDANKITLMSILKKNNCDVIDMGIVVDEPTTLLRSLISAMKKTDVVVSSGGVSMGEKDYFKPVLESDLGATIHFGRVNMKPGKPTTCATVLFEGQEKLIFGLPGNPASTVVACILFVLPSLRQMQGCLFEDKMIKLKMCSDTEYSLDSRPEFYRASFQNANDESVFIRLGGEQPSSDLCQFSGANILACLPVASPNQKKILPGQSLEVNAILIDKYL